MKPTTTRAMFTSKHAVIPNLFHTIFAIFKPSHTTGFSFCRLVNSEASFDLCTRRMSLACTHLLGITSGASRMYLINAAATVRYPDDFISNLHICEWLAAIPHLSVLSIIGAAEVSSTTLSISVQVLLGWKAARYIISGVAKVRFLLLPEEEDMKLLHQRCEHICNILQRLGTFFQ